MFGLLLFIHILGATIWTGGHIVLSIVVLPKILKNRSPEDLLDFEEAYEKIGLPAFAIQIITGLILAYRIMPDISQWFVFSNPNSIAIFTKLALLVLTLAFALDAKFRVIPKLSAQNLREMAWHIIPVTILSILFVLAGVSFRAGWFY